MKKIENAMRVTQGDGKVDLRIDNCKIADVHNGVFFEASLCIHDGIVVGYEKLEATKVVDAKSAYVLPNFIDGHVHIESSMLSPLSFGELVLPLGTGTVVADPHEIANVQGLDGIRFMLKSATKTPLDVQMMLPSCVPALPFEDAGACLLADDLEKLISDENVLGLGEMMNVFGVTGQDSEVMDKIKLAKRYNKVIDGHSPEVFGSVLDAYALSGIKTDHECTSVDEVVDRIRRGMYVIVREGSATRDLAKLLPAITPFNARFCIFCTDDRHAADILDRGHINSLVAMAVRLGLDPMLAIRMATLNTAECYKLENKGSLAVGREAGFMLVNSIGGKDGQDEKAFVPHAVYVKGEEVAQNGKMLKAVCAEKDADLQALTQKMQNSVKFTMPQSLDLKIASGKARVIKIFPHSLYTECEVQDVSIDEKGNFVQQANGPLKIAVVERHKNTGKIGLGLLDAKYGLKNGAIATSIGHDSHNILVAGDNDADMLKALECMQDMRGGIVMISQGKVLASLPLELGGLMTDDNGQNVAQKLETLQSLAKEHYQIWEETDAFMLLSFLALSVLPKFKITASGLFDLSHFKFFDIDAEI